jgi:hypothetical protein
MLMPMLSLKRMLWRVNGAPPRPSPKGREVLSQLDVEVFGSYVFPKEN